jgi:uncharacterized protein YcaQ
MTQHLSAAASRRIALAAQGFGAAPPPAVGTRQLGLVIRRLNLLQLDSVNVFERSHYMPVFSRLGSYDKATLDALTLARRAPHLEYWAHQAAIIPVGDWPLFDWRMRGFRDRYSVERSSFVAANGPLMQWLKDELRVKGPLLAREIEHDANVRKGSWWGWSDAKEALEILFLRGEIVSAGRTRFERRYALPEQVLKPVILDARIEPQDARRELIRRAATALGVATRGDLADYYRMRTDETSAAILDLVDSGELIPVRVEGWKDQGYLWHSARRPRAIDAAALLTPFDPVVWYRPRTERMFDFHYRIEIYTPEAQRTFGYYSLPILLGDRVVGRIDLKADRKPGVLRVQSAWHEVGAPADTAERLAPLLRHAAAWQGLTDIVVADRGNLSGALAETVRLH